VAPASHPVTQEIEFDRENDRLLTRAVLIGRDLQYRDRQGAAASSLISSQLLRHYFSQLATNWTSGDLNEGNPL
jgi:hypothetical protein